jgi:hypothetical protein
MSVRDLPSSLRPWLRAEWRKSSSIIDGSSSRGMLRGTSTLQVMMVSSDERDETQRVTRVRHAWLSEKSSVRNLDESLFLPTISDHRWVTAMKSHPRSACRAQSLPVCAVACARARYGSFPRFGLPRLTADSAGHSAMASSPSAAAVQRCVATSACVSSPHRCVQAKVECVGYDHAAKRQVSRR